MASVIDFKSKVEEILDVEDVFLNTFKLTKRDVDVKELYDYIDRRYKVNIVDENGVHEYGMGGISRKDMFSELTRVSTYYDSKRVAWVVLDNKEGYMYIKELDNIYYAKIDNMKANLKKHMYAYGIDYMMILQKIGVDTYRWVMS